ncbi:hypothetical protein OIU34_17005 [Pararhizobium sp. BT-229]|uniref:hypothetical protein n=1 Tax=Pararhizobium sp. BT-229 TaxID=2986923 RepID=UPI0021F7AF55|nr:hypothetical protein [Pararhizobium sp. BT-229]MCV9963600.1 hypothetical protein [Pararhizobium sp. BT-229]
MSFAAKLVAYSVAASAALALSPVLINAEPVKIEYGSVNLDSAKAKELWGDILPNVEMAGDQPPSIFVAKAGDGLEISLIYASNMCSMDKCPIRVFEGGVKIEDTMGCYNITEHKLAESERAMVACDDVILINRKK